MKVTTLGALTIVAGTVLAQDAAQPTVDLGPESSATPVPAKTPEVPELSQLDQVFKQTSLGKAADEYRTRIEWRKLQNETMHEAAVIAAKKAADSARTDLEKRERLRDYYNIYYGRMRGRASSQAMKTAIDTFKDEHLRQLAQPRVRPSGDEPIPTPTPKGHKHRQRK